MNARETTAKILKNPNDPNFKYEIDVYSYYGSGVQETVLTYMLLLPGDKKPRPLVRKLFNDISFGRGRRYYKPGESWHNIGTQAIQLFEEQRKELVHQLDQFVHFQHMHEYTVESSNWQNPKTLISTDYYTIYLNGEEQFQIHQQYPDGPIYLNRPAAFPTHVKDVEIGPQILHYVLYCQMSPKDRMARGA